MKNDSTGTLPWWLQPGSDACSGCEVTLHVEALVVCHRCDRPFCLICLPAETDTRICSSCRQEEEQ